MRHISANWPRATSSVRDWLARPGESIETQEQRHRRSIPAHIGIGSPGLERALRPFRFPFSSPQLLSWDWLARPGESIETPGSPLLQEPTPHRDWLARPGESIETSSRGDLLNLHWISGDWLARPGESIETGVMRSKPTCVIAFWDWLARPGESIETCTCEFPRKPPA